MSLAAPNQRLRPRKEREQVMPMHGPVSNKTYAKKIYPFAKAERHRGLWQIFDTRPNKVLSETCESEAKSWKSLAAKLLSNGGLLIDHGTKKAIERVRDNRLPPTERPQPEG